MGGLWKGAPVGPSARRPAGPSTNPGVYVRFVEPSKNGMDSSTKQSGSGAAMGRR